ncbi:MAG TPA: ThiF family adenylyltransferase [Acidobacteriaceae bacterium]|jgi:molybdopterin/thiamine biosynthesis adenylyltransferase|nr:ThiF family adenylyltransferase [Acidobacteriaceae bacterium]
MSAFTTYDPATPNADSIPAPISDSERYSRQILFAPIGQTGQNLLARAHVAIVGVGATGAATASLLARAGVGHLTLIDRDFVEPSNLQRQMLFDEDDARAALPKAEAARRHLARINSSVRIDAAITDLVPANAPTLLAADLVLDCTDNFETRYLINDLCVRDHRPWIYAAAVGAYAATMNILPRALAPATKPGAPSSTTAVSSSKVGSHDAQGLQEAYATTAPPLLTTHYPLRAASSCLACIFPSAPSGNVDTCDTAGILSTAVNLAASLQVTEALKFLTRQPEQMRRTLLSFDLWLNTRSEINTSTPRPDCEVCNQRIFRHLSGEQRPHITLCGRNSVQIHQHHHPLNLAELELRLQPLGQVRANGLLLRFTYDPYTLTVFPDGRALIQGTTDPALARSLYARFLGS